MKNSARMKLMVGRIAREQNGHKGGDFITEKNYDKRKLHCIFCTTLKPRRTIKEGVMLKKRKK